MSRPPGRVSLYNFDPDHQRRADEATVKKLETEAEQADNDRQMRKDIAELGAVVVQVIAVGLVIVRSLFPPEKKSG